MSSICCVTKYLGTKGLGPFWRISKVVSRMAANGQQVFACVMFESRLNVVTTAPINTGRNYPDLTQLTFALLKLTWKQSEVAMSSCLMVKSYPLSLVVDREGKIKCLPIV